MKKEKLLKRTYRITVAQDKFIKRHKKKSGGESEYIRQMVETDRKLKGAKIFA